MQSVPAPALVVAVVVAAAAIALAVATGGSASSPAPAKPKPDSRALIQGVQLQSARCAQWKAGTSTERANVVKALAFSVGGSTPYGNGTTLADTEARDLFDRACASNIAEHWLLYEIYIRAAGFRSYQER